MKPLRRSGLNPTSANARTFFVTIKTSMSRRLLQSERNAMLFVEVLRSYAAAKKFRVLDFVVMPDHVHLLLTVEAGMTIERAMQFIKGGFSFRLKKETGYCGEVWQRGFSEVRVENQLSLKNHRYYIAQNPVKAGLANSPGEFPFCFSSFVERRKRRLKPGPQTERHRPG